MQWGIESVAALAAAQVDMSFAGNAPTSASAGTAAPDLFANLMQRELGELNNSVGAAETAMRDLAAGKPVG